MKEGQFLHLLTFDGQTTILSVVCHRPSIDEILCHVGSSISPVVVAVVDVTDYILSRVQAFEDYHSPDK